MAHLLHPLELEDTLPLPPPVDTNMANRRTFPPVSENSKRLHPSFYVPPPGKNPKTGKVYNQDCRKYVASQWGAGTPPFGDGKNTFPLVFDQDGGTISVAFYWDLQKKTLEGPKSLAEIAAAQVAGLGESPATAFPNIDSALEYYVNPATEGAKVPIHTMPFVLVRMRSNTPRRMVRGRGRGAGRHAGGRGVMHGEGIDDHGELCACCGRLINVPSWHGLYDCRVKEHLRITPELALDAYTDLEVVTCCLLAVGHPCAVVARLPLSQLECQPSLKLVVPLDQAAEAIAAELTAYTGPGAGWRSMVERCPAVPHQQQQVLWFDKRGYENRRGEGKTNVTRNYCDIQGHLGKGRLTILMSETKEVNQASIDWPNLEKNAAGSTGFSVNLFAWHGRSSDFHLPLLVRRLASIAQDMFLDPAALDFSKSRSTSSCSLTAMSHSRHR